MSKKECVVCKKSLLAMDAQISEGGNSYHKGACHRLSRRAPRRARRALARSLRPRAPLTCRPPPPLRPAGCFKCSVCNGQLTILNLSTINGTL
jgi:hypothetical protein